MKYMKYVWIFNLIVGLLNLLIVYLLWNKSNTTGIFILNIISAIGNFYFVYQKWKK